MKLIRDGQAVSEPVSAGLLEGALDRLSARRSGSLELRRDNGGYLRAEHSGPEGCLLSVRQRADVFGLTIPDRDFSGVRAAFQEFFRGYTPRLPWKLLLERPARDVRHIVIGEPYRDDCPLCRMFGASG